MSDNYETVGDAVRYCQEHNLKKSSAASDLFETAEALLKAYRNGQESVNNAINEQAKEMGGICLIQAQPSGCIPLLRLPPKEIKLTKLS